MKLKFAEPNPEKYETQTDRDDLTKEEVVKLAMDSYQWKEAKCLSWYNFQNNTWAEIRRWSSSSVSKRRKLSTSCEKRQRVCCRRAVLRLFQGSFEAALTKKCRHDLLTG